MLCLCPVPKSILAESRQNDLLSLSASHITAMPEVTDGKNIIGKKVIQQNGTVQASSF